jgi:hypothetical protein
MSLWLRTLHLYTINTGSTYLDWLLRCCRCCFFYCPSPIWTDCWDVVAVVSSTVPPLSELTVEMLSLLFLLLSLPYLNWLLRCCHCCFFYSPSPIWTDCWDVVTVVSSTLPPLSLSGFFESDFLFEWILFWFWGFFSLVSWFLFVFWLSLDLPMLSRFLCSQLLRISTFSHSDCCPFTQASQYQQRFCVYSS